MIPEDQIKGPSGNMRREQSAHPQSFGKSVSFGGDGLPTRRNKKKKKRKQLQEELDSILGSSSTDTREARTKQLTDAISKIMATGPTVDKAN